MNEAPQRELPNEIPLPTAMRELINSNNMLLQNMQQELLQRVNVANAEMMQILGLNPKDGWRLDLDKMKYVKQDEPSSE